MVEVDVAGDPGATRALDEMPELVGLVISPRTGGAGPTALPRGNAAAQTPTGPAATGEAATGGAATGRAATVLGTAGEDDGAGDRAAPAGIFVGERFPTLEIATPRLSVRQLRAADAEPVDAIFNDRVTRRWLPVPAGSGPIDGRSWCTEMAAERRAMGAGDHYGMIRREDGQLVGVLWTKRTDWPARSTEVCVATAADARGFGFAPEAVDGLVVELVTQHGFQRIEMRVAAGDTSSRRVAEKAGFTYEGLMRNAGTVPNGRVDLQLWSLVSADLH